MQDIAGCRIVVQDLVAQDEVVHKLKSVFDNLEVDDRRERPSHGYRAVHVILEKRGKLIEVQVRTKLQHAWAELSQKLSDVVDGAIKYGGGDEELVSLLSTTSNLTMDWDLTVKTRDHGKMLETSQRLFEVQERLAEVVRRVREAKR